MAEKTEIFICYAHKDESLMRELEDHLKSLVRQGRITLWHDRNVAAGSDWKQEVHNHLDSAPIILLLVSANFLASDYRYIEVERAMERFKAGEAQVIPIILRPVNWRGSLFGKLSPLPEDGRPITSSSWHNHDEAFFDVVEGIEKIIESIKSSSVVENPPPQGITKEPILLKETPRMTQEQQTFDVFLCYTSADRDAVKQIGEELKKHGVRPWLDVWELRPGLPWQRALEKQIDEIKTAAVFVGKGGIGPWQQMEMEAFLREFVKHGSPVIPVLLPDAPEKPVLPVFLRGMHWVDFRRAEPEPMGQLVWGITGKNPYDGSEESSGKGGGDNGHNSSSSPAFEEKAMPNTTFSNGYALLIGADVNLPITTKDATALYNVLINPSRAAYPEEHVQLLTEEKATRQGILDAFDKLTEQVKNDPNATVVVYFSGHGLEITHNGASTEYFLIPYGYNPSQLRDISLQVSPLVSAWSLFNRSQRAQTAISGIEFSAKIEAIKARKLVVLLDCCHAGGMPVVKAAGENVEKSSLPLPSDVLHTLEQGSGRVIVASSRKEETSWTGDPYSVFTTCLIEALAGRGAKNPDGFARVLDVLGYLFATVPQRAFGPQHPFVNNIRDLDDNFPLCYYAGGSKEIPGSVAMPPPPAPMPQNTQLEQPLISSRRQDLLRRRERLYKNIAYYEEEYDNTAGAKARLEIEREIERQKKVLQEVEDELGRVD